MCRLCPSTPCNPAYHAASASVRAHLRERVQAILSRPSPQDLSAAKRQYVPARPEGSPAIAIRAPRAKPAKHTGGRTPVTKKLTVDLILSRQRARQPISSIAEEFGCSVALISKRLRKALDDGTLDPQVVKDMRTCPACKATKKPSAEVCNRCAVKARRSAERSAA